MRKKETRRTPMDAALYYLGLRARTVREMERYLDEKQYGEYEVYQVVERLKELDYLNDEKYAADFIRSRLSSKPVSRRRLAEQLYQHGVEKEIIDRQLGEISDIEETENARAVAEKYMQQFAALPERERAERVIKRMTARGFSYETIKSVLREIEVEEGASDETGYYGD